MVNPKNLSSEQLEQVLNQGYSLNEVLTMHWNKINKIIKVSEE